jgi:acyl-CoA synthetase (AMP-forming)/AMP-acid ligase II
VPQPRSRRPRTPPRAARTLAARFAELRRARGDALAVLDADRRVTVTRDDLACAADRIGALLRAVPPGGARGIVAIQIPNGADFFASVLACWERDLVPMPVDHDVAAQAVIDLCHAVGASALLRVAAEGEIVAVPWRDAAGCAAALAPTTALLKVTSGTTGEPRAVALATAALEAGVAQIVSTMGLEPADRNLVTIPLAHSYAFDNVVLTLLRDGMPAILTRDLTPRRLLAVARDGAATVLPTVPFLIDVLGRAQRAGRAPALRRVISAGAPLPAVARERFARLFGVRPRTFYGATECGGIAFDRDGEGDLPDGTVGTPLDGVRVALLDRDEDGVGRVEVHSRSVADGYLPERAADLASANDVALVDGAFRTADLGRLDERGRLCLVGRVHEVINVGGRKVYPAEVERVIRDVPGVLDVVVSGVARSAVADALRAVVAAEPHVSREDVAAACARRLARYKVPRSIEIVRELPRTGRGKIDRRALDARYPIG